MKRIKVVLFVIVLLTVFSPETYASTSYSLTNFFEKMNKQKYPDNLKWIVDDPEFKQAFTDSAGSEIVKIFYSQWGKSRYFQQLGSVERNNSGIVFKIQNLDGHPFNCAFLIDVTNNRLIICWVDHGNKKLSGIYYPGKQRRGSAPDACENQDMFSLVRN